MKNTNLVSDMLIEEFVKPMKLSFADLVVKLDLDRSTVEGLLFNKVRVSKRIAEKIGVAFSMTPDFWIKLQATDDKRWDESEEAERVRQGFRS